MVGFVGLGRIAVCNIIMRWFCRVLSTVFVGKFSKVANVRYLLG